MREDRRNILRDMGLASTIGITLVVSTVIGGLAGWLLDKKLGTSPWFTLALGLLGIAAGFIEMFRIVKQIGEDESKK